MNLKLSTGYFKTNQREQTVFAFCDFDTKYYLYMPINCFITSTAYKVHENLLKKFIFYFLVKLIIDISFEERA